MSRRRVLICDTLTVVAKTGEGEHVVTAKSSKRTWLAIVLAANAIAVISVVFLYTRDMRDINQRLVAGSRLVDTRHGKVEFSSWGSGPTVLVVHGAGGGYDQGELLPLVFGGDGYRWISVSRFGYLQSTMPRDASTVAQAEAFADMLDALNVDRVAILAMSGGVPPALQFAQKFPNRTTALMLLSSAPFTPLTAEEQDLAIPAWIYQALFSSDFAFWAIVKLFPSALDTLFDVSGEARAQMTAQDRVFVSGLVAAFLPVTARTAGLRNEGAAIDPRTRYDLERVAAPTLVVHARDDGINPFEFGAFAARNIADAELLPLPSGGHLLLGHTEDVRERVRSFLQLHVPSSNERSEISH